MNNDTSTMNLPQMLCIKTDKGCFISDCLTVNGYNYEYHRTEIDYLLFDGKKAIEAHCKNWYYIDKYPSLIQRKESGEIINRRYEIKNASLISNSLPAIIPYEEAENYDSDVVDALYFYKYDRGSPCLKEIIYDIQIICEIENYNFPPKIEYKGFHRNRSSYSDEQYIITNANVQHQMLDKIIFPEVTLHEYPCKFTSKQMYDITRQYIIENIDNSVAKIVHNYDHLVEVRKIIPMIEPETVTYTNMFAKTKREKNKIHTVIKEYDEKKIFSMTHQNEQYKGYPIIPEMRANNETELKEKVDMWLENLIKLINEPLCQCPQCKGLGYINNVSEIGFDYK